MLKVAPIALFLIPGLVHAVICTTVDADGVVSYTEAPASVCKAPVELCGYALRPQGQEAAPAYDSIRIVHPEIDQQLSGKVGKVSLAMALEPPLQPCASGCNKRLSLNA